MSPPLVLAGAGRRSWRLALAPVLVTFLLASSAEHGSTNEDEHASGLDIPVVDSCTLCTDSLEVPLVRLDPAALDSLALLFAVHNEQQIACIDSIYHAGNLGRPDRDETRRRAHLLARLTTTNSYRFLAHYACDTTQVFEADESALADVFKRYSDPSLFSIARLRRLRVGLGHVCLRYDVAEDVEGESVLGGKPLRYRTKTATLSGKERRVLSLDLPTGTEDVVEVLLAEHYSCAVEHSFGDGPSGPYEVFLVHEIQGGWLRKHGTHRPTAFMFWVTPQTPARLDLPKAPLVGVRIYIPRLRFKLPFILPDINIDDLREIELPQPILEMNYLVERRFPNGWLSTDESLGFKRWTGHGAVPESLRVRFPDS